MRTARDILDAPTWDLLDGYAINADCIEAMEAIPDCSVDAVVTDPPAGISFMGRAASSKAAASHVDRGQVTIDDLLEEATA